MWLLLYQLPLYVRVLVRVRTCIRICICIRVCICVRIHVHIRFHICVRILVRIRVHIHAVNEGIIVYRRSSSSSSASSSDCGTAIRFGAIRFGISGARHTARKAATSMLGGIKTSSIT